MEQVLDNVRASGTYIANDINPRTKGISNETVKLWSM